MQILSDADRATQKVLREIDDYRANHAREMAEMEQLRAENDARHRAANQAAQRFYASLAEHNAKIDAAETQHLKLVYSKIVQGKQGLLNAAETKVAHPRKTNEPVTIFVATLVHHGTSVNDAYNVAEEVLEALNIFDPTHHQRALDLVFFFIISKGPEVRRAFHDFLIALSAGLTPKSTTDPTPQGNGFNDLPYLYGYCAHDRRVTMLWFVGAILERTLHGIQDLTTRGLTAERKKLFPQVRWLKRLLKQLFALAACRGGFVHSPFGTTLQETVDSWAYNMRHVLNYPVFSTLEIRKLYEVLNSRDPRTPAEINNVARDDTSSALRAIGDPVVPRSHGVAADPGAPFHQLPAGNFARVLRERGFPLIARAAPRTGYLFDGADQPWDPETAKATNDVMAEMLRQFEPTDADEVQDINELGNKVWKDPERPTRNYWGFSEEGLAAMKANREAEKKTAIGYGDVPLPERSHAAVSREIDRARELASRGRGGGNGERGRGFGRGRGGFRGGRGY